MVMNYLCCEPLQDNGSHSDGSITCSTDEGILECDYDTQVTKLYHHIEERKWEEVLYFLETGSFYNNSIFSVFGEQGDGPSVQARTWVTALDEAGNVRWCQLPLHAAVTFLAPFAVITKLIEVYPKSVRCADDQDMLPLHYAFRFGAGDDVLLHLLEKFPQAIGKKAVKERLPLGLAQFGPRPERGGIIDFFVQNAIRTAKAEWDSDYEKMVASMRDHANYELTQNINMKNDKLIDAQTELERAQAEVLRLEVELAKRSSDPSVSGSDGKSSRSIKKTLSSKSATSKKKVQSKAGSDNDSSIKSHDKSTNTQKSPTEKSPRGRTRKAPSSSKKGSNDSVTSRRSIGNKLFGKRKK